MVLSSSPVSCDHHHDHRTRSLWFYILHKSLSCHLFRVLFKQLSSCRKAHGCFCHLYSESQAMRGRQNFKMISKILTPGVTPVIIFLIFWQEGEMIQTGLIYSHEPFRSREFSQTAGRRKSQRDFKGVRKFLGLTVLKIEGDMWEEMQVALRS